MNSLNAGNTFTSNIEVRFSPDIPDSWKATLTQVPLSTDKNQVICLHIEGNRYAGHIEWIGWIVLPEGYKTMVVANTGLIREDQRRVILLGGSNGAGWEKWWLNHTGTWVVPPQGEVVRNFVEDIAYWALRVVIFESKKMAIINSKGDWFIDAETQEWVFHEAKIDKVRGVQYRVTPQGLLRYIPVHFAGESLPDIQKGVKIGVGYALKHLSNVTPISRIA